MENATCNKGKEDNYYHEGVVETLNFPWIEYNIQLINDNKSDKSNKDEDDDNTLIIILSIFIAVILIVIIIVVFVFLRKKKFKNIRDNIEDISFFCVLSIMKIGNYYLNPKMIFIFGRLIYIFQIL